MRNLLNFLAKYNYLIVFLILEGISLYLLGTHNNYHNTRILKGTRGIIKGIDEKMNNARNYFHLREINQALALENASLKNSIDRLKNKENLLFFSVSDTLYHQQYKYTSSEVVDNEVNRQKNFFTLNKGTDQGLMADMGITSEDGVAGVIVGCSRNYSVAMSLLNLDFKLSARLKSNGFFGSLGWDGKDRNYAILSEIPQHVTFAIGDTVETTGYSAVFPEGIMVGTVSDFEKSEGDFYKIKVFLKTNFKKLHFVSVIGNLKKKEQLELEKQFQ